MEEQDFLTTAREIHTNLSSVSETLSDSLNSLFTELLEASETDIRFEKINVTYDSPANEYSCSLILHKITKEGDLIVSNSESLIHKEEDKIFEIEFSETSLRDRLYIIELMIEYHENLKTL